MYPLGGLKELSGWRAWLTRISQGSESSVKVGDGGNWSLGIGDKDSLPSGFGAPSSRKLPTPLGSEGTPVKKQPSQDILQGDAAEEELGLACLVSSYTLPHQNSQPGRRGWQTARSKVLSRRARDT